MARRIFESLLIQVKKNKKSYVFFVRTKNGDSNLQKTSSMVLMHKKQSPGGVLYSEKNTLNIQQLRWVTPAGSTCTKSIMQAPSYVWNLLDFEQVNTNLQLTAQLLLLHIYSFKDATTFFLKFASVFFRIFSFE